MEQIIFKAATYYDQLLSWKTLRAVSLFNHSTCSHPSLELVYLFCNSKDGNHLFFDVHCVVFICCTTSCTNRCHSLYNSLSFVVPFVVIRYHSLSIDVPHVCLFINDCTQPICYYYKYTWIRSFQEVPQNFKHKILENKLRKVIVKFQALKMNYLLFTPEISRILLKV